MTRPPGTGIARPGPRRHIIRPPRRASQELPVRPADAAAAGTRKMQLAPASPAPARGSEYAELSRQVRQAGLLERRPGYYAWKIAVTTGLLGAGWAGFAVVGDSWWQLAVAVFLAVVFTQIGFLGHDAGHRQVFGTRRASYVAGILLGNLGIGLSYRCWVDKHNRHHAHPNTEDADPDIAVGALAFTAAQARAGRGAAPPVLLLPAAPLPPPAPRAARSLPAARAPPRPPPAAGPRAPTPPPLTLPPPPHPTPRSLR